MYHFDCFLTRRAGRPHISAALLFGAACVAGCGERAKTSGTGVASTGPETPTGEIPPNVPTAPSKATTPDTPGVAGAPGEPAPVGVDIGGAPNAAGRETNQPPAMAQGGAGGSTTAPPADPKEEPNIVIVLADDMGWGDSGTYGHDLIQTPNMDRMAAEGVKLTQAYSAAGVCSPSRSAILTGRTPYRNGVYRHLSGNHEAHLRAEEITYPELVKKAGYEAVHVGKWHLLSANQFNQPGFPQPNDQGYDYWFATHNNASPSHANPDNFIRNGQALGRIEGYSAQIVAGEAVNWLKNVRAPEKPFVLSVWFHEPHSPIATDSRFAALYPGHDNAEYMGNISQLDHALGLVLDALDDVGEADNTFVFFTSDNGPVPAFGGTSGGLRGVKRSEYEGGIRVPGLVRWPGVIPAGSESDIPVIGSDVFTTVLDLVGIPVPADRTIDGVNMMPALMGEPVERDIPLFWRTHVSPVDERVAMRIGDWKIVGDETLTQFQLYDVQTDWQEMNDLAQEMPDRTEQMKTTLLQLWEDISSEGPNQWWEADGQGY